MTDVSVEQRLADSLRAALASHEVLVFATAAGLPALGQDAGRHPNGVLAEALARGRQVFGYEIPGNGDPALRPFLAACSGNIDPQHTAVSATDGVPPAAIEAALDAYPLPPGSLLITPKADLDALGAMVVHAGRSAGLDLGAPGVSARIGAVAAGDRSARGPWRLGATAEKDPVCGPLSGIVADPAVPLRSKLDSIIEYLATGSFPGLAASAARRAAGRSRLAANVAAHGGVRVMAEGMVALVTTTLPGAFSVGYQHAPIVIAHCPRHTARGWAETGRRYTIGRWNGTVDQIDLTSLAVRLNRVEPGWGGQRDIIGSPMSGLSAIPLESLLGIVEEALRSRGIS